MKNKIFTALLSLVLAFGLWAYVVTVVHPDWETTFYNVPVVLQGESVLQEQGLMITSDRKPTVNLRLSGNRIDLNKLSSSDITLMLDLTKIYEPGEHKLAYTVAFPGYIPGGSVTVQSRNPDRISVKVEQQLTQEVEVVVTYSGSPKKDYMRVVDGCVLDYPTITVTGPSSVVEKIALASIEVDIDGKSESFSQQYEYTLCDVNGEPVDSKTVTTNVGSVNLSVMIQRFKELPLVLNVIPGGGATEETSNIVIEPKTIKVRGSEAALEGMEFLEIGTIDLGKLTENTERKFPINTPAGVFNLTGITEATVNVAFPDLKMAEFVVTNIQAVNIPAGMNVELVTLVLPVTVRGSKNVVETMSPEDITVMVDFSTAQLGTSTFEATILIASDKAGVGAMGTYIVTATLTEALLPPA